MCKLPDNQWDAVASFNDKELEQFQKLVDAYSKLIMEYSRNGGILGSRKKKD